MPVRLWPGKFREPDVVYYRAEHLDHVDLGISPNLLSMLPFLFTIVVLWVGAGEAMRKHIGAPAALMQPYSREER